jgi:hypothetical protein
VYYDNNMIKNEVINLRVPAAVKAALKLAAEADDRSVSSMALKIIREWLAVRGLVGDMAKGPQRRAKRQSPR